MLSKLLNKKRDGEKESSSGRTDRFLKKDSSWFFKTREGFEVGPFGSKSEAQYALLFFVEQSDWPSETQLNDFIEGCQLNAGQTR